MSILLICISYVLKYIIKFREIKLVSPPQGRVTFMLRKYQHCVFVGHVMQRPVSVVRVRYFPCPSIVTNLAPRTFNSEGCHASTNATECISYEQKPIRLFLCEGKNRFFTWRKG